MNGKLNCTCDTDINNDGVVDDKDTVEIEDVEKKVDSLGRDNTKKRGPKVDGGPHIWINPKIQNFLDENNIILKQSKNTFTEFYIKG